MSDLHRFSRLELLLGSATLDLLNKRSVAVFGLGGVGSYAAEALVRGGVGHLTLVDFDEIDVSNINRQLHATDDTVGRPKAQVMAKRCRLINPAAEIEPLQAFYSAETASELLSRHYDYVLDCIDQVTAKLHLIQACLERQVPIIASMGAANKCDPKLIKVSDLAHTHKCRLARIIRRELRRRGIHGGLKVVYSIEDFRPLTDQRRTPGEQTGAGYQERRAPLGSSSVIPPLFGLTMAGEVLLSLQEGAP